MEKCWLLNPMRYWRFSLVPGAICEQVKFQFCFARHYSGNPFRQYKRTNLLQKYYLFWEIGNK